MLVDDQNIRYVGRCMGRNRDTIRRLIDDILRFLYSNKKDAIQFFLCELSMTNEEIVKLLINIKKRKRKMSPFLSGRIDDMIIYARNIR